MKLWQKRKKSQTPQPGIEPGTPANAADALPLSHFPSFPSSFFLILFLSFPLPFPSTLRLRIKISLFAFIPFNKFSFAVYEMQDISSKSILFFCSSIFLERRISALLTLSHHEVFLRTAKAVGVFCVRCACEKKRERERE